MVSGLEPIAFSIVEPWTIADLDIAHYLCDLGVKFSMRGTTNIKGGANSTIYTAKMTAEDATLIKLIFPNISITPCAAPEKVSITARRV
jgi:hypothetical protein